MPVSQTDYSAGHWSWLEVLGKYGSSDQLIQQSLSDLNINNSRANGVHLPYGPTFSQILPLGECKDRGGPEFRIAVIDDGSGHSLELHFDQGNASVVLIVKHRYSCQDLLSLAIVRFVFCPLEHQLI